MSLPRRRVQDPNFEDSRGQKLTDFRDDRGPPIARRDDFHRKLRRHRNDPVDRSTVRQSVSSHDENIRSANRVRLPLNQHTSVVAGDDPGIALLTIPHPKQSADVAADRSMPMTGRTHRDNLSTDQLRRCLKRHPSELFSGDEGGNAHVRSNRRLLNYLVTTCFRSLAASSSAVASGCRSRMAAYPFACRSWASCASPVSTTRPASMTCVNCGRLNSSRRS